MTGDWKSRGGGMGIGDILQGVLGRTRIVDPGLAGAVKRAAVEHWPNAEDGSVEVVDFKRGVLHVALDTHARLAEARAFVGESFRERVNELMGAQEGPVRSGAGERVVGKWHARDASYVTRIVFRVRGTHT